MRLWEPNGRGFPGPALVFDVGDEVAFGFGDTAEPGFPVAVQSDPVDVALAGIGLPAGGFAGGKVDVTAGTGGLVPDYLGHFRTDVFPGPAVLGVFPAGAVVRHRHPGKFNDATFDSVHKGEIAHRS